VLAGINTEGRVESTRSEEEPKTGGMGRKRKELKDETGE
jgi:hypothetical protein